MSCVEEAAGGIVGHASAEPRRRPGVAVGPAQSLDASARDNKDRQRATIGWWLTGQAPRDECSGTKSRRSSTHSVERSVSGDDCDEKMQESAHGKVGALPPVGAERRRADDQLEVTHCRAHKTSQALQKTSSEGKKAG